MTIGKLARPRPAGIRTVAGTLAKLASELDNVINTPPAGALALRKIVPEMVIPAEAVLAESAAKLKRGSISSVFCSVTAPYEATIKGVWVACTGCVFIGKLALLALARTVMLEGTEITAGLVLDREIVVPPAGAAVARFTFPVVPLPPTKACVARYSESSE